MLPSDIEKESFRIIQSEMGPHSFSEAELPVVVRVIHATADFTYKDILRFSPEGISSGIDAIRGGCTIVTDVRMVAVGINSGRVERFGGKVICAIDTAEVRQTAARQRTTRATASIRSLKDDLQGGILVVGNAPTALIEGLRLYREDGIRPALVVGVPVGFVNAVESKDELAATDLDFITTIGRKGGSTVAAAIVNALLRLAEGD